MSAVPQVPANSLPAPGWSWGNASAGAAAGAGAARALRRRAAVQALAGVAVAVALWLLWRTPLAYLVAAIAVGLALLAAASPPAYARVSRVLEAFGRWVGIAVTWVLMALLFYGLFLPVGLLLRARRSLRVTTGFDPQAPSYWTRPAARTAGPEGYRKQF